MFLENAYAIFETSSDFWLGFQRFEDTYFWVDGSPVDYSDWNKEEPVSENGHDAAIFSMQDNGLWNTADMSTSRPSVCKISSTKKV